MLNWDPKESLADYFQRFSAYTVDGIPGVLCIDSQEPGPVLGISGMTHGNEPVGLKAFQALSEKGSLNSLKKGKLYLFLMNLKAAGAYFNSPDNCFSFRCADQDMNRLPTSLDDSSNYEVQRVAQLLPLFKELTHVLDLHSTSQASPPMIIEMMSQKSFPETLFPDVTVIVRGLTDFLKGLPLISYMGTQDTERYVLECGEHEAKSTAICGSQAILSFLTYLGLLDAPLEKAENRDVYDIYQGISFPNATYAFDRLIENFEYLPQDFQLANGDLGPIVVPRKSYAIMPPAEICPTYYATDFMYLAERL